MGHLSWAGEECQRRLTVGPETWKVKVTQGGVKKKKGVGERTFLQRETCIQGPRVERKHGLFEKLKIVQVKATSSLRQNTSS